MLSTTMSILADAAATVPVSAPAGGADTGHGTQLLQDLAVVMIVAGLVTVVFHRLKQPVVLGYILAGLIVGPHTSSIPLSVHSESVNPLADLGLVFLMFGLGLHFSLRQLARVGTTALTAAALEIVLMIVIGYVLGKAFGWNDMNSLFLGAILCISSTTIIIKALSDLGMSRKPFADVIFGILVVEDILAIALITLLSTIASTGTLQVGDVGVTIGRLSVFLAAVLVLGLLLVPVLIGYVDRFKNAEILLVAVLGMCFGVSLLGVRMGFSVALGAFLIGAIIAETREHERIEQLVSPVRDMFSAVFFVAIGMQIAPGILREYMVPIVVITAAVVVGKVLTCAAGTFITGHDMKTSLRVGMGLAQIGEFSFIIALMGKQKGVTEEFLYPLAVSVSAVTTLLTPYMIRYSDRVSGLINRAMPKSVSASLKLYSLWLERRRAEGHKGNMVRVLMRRWMIQVALNLALAAAVFLTAAYFARQAPQWEWLGRLPRWTGGVNGVFWLGAMLVSLPLLIATLRKVRAAAMLLAEVAVTRREAGPNTATARSVIQNLIFISAVVMTLLGLVLLSSAILPPLRVLAVFVPVVLLVAILTWRWMIKLYAKAQIALRDTLADQPPEP